MTEFNIEHNFEDLRHRLDDIDMENVERMTLKRSANALAEMVREAIVAEDDITSPADLNSIYEGGDGYPLSQRKAWVVEKSRGSWTVRPHPQVEQRATVLNYGYPGRITPNNADALRFTINGVPIYRDWVEGPDETGYWQAALRRFRKSGELERIAQAELREEALK